MGKDREGVYHPGKGKPSGANKEEGTGLRKTFPPDQLEQDEKMTDRYTAGEDQISPDVHVRHPNRNTSKREDFSKTEDHDYTSRNQAFDEDVSKTEPEELLGILTKDVFTDLASYEGDPCISIYLPTHRRGVEVNEQVDPISFKNILQDVEKTLKEKNFGEMVIKRVLEPAYDMLRDDKLWYDMTEGFAVFMSDGYIKYLKLRGHVNEYLRINKSFYVGPLARFIVRPEYFYILDIAKKFPRFFRADAYGIEELQVEGMPTDVSDVVRFENKDDEKLFRTGGKGGTGSANFHGIGGGKPDEKQHIAIYLKEVHDTIWQSHLNKQTAPLLISGQDFLIPIFKSVARYAYIWPEALTGNHHHQSEKELYDEAMPVMKPHFEKRMNAALEEYGNKLATSLTSSMEDKVIPAAHYGQVAVLFVREGFSRWGTFDMEQNKLKLTAGETDGVEDMVDKAVIRTIQNGGEVFFLTAEQMPKNADIAALFRY